MNNTPNKALLFGRQRFRTDLLTISRNSAGNGVAVDGAIERYALNTPRFSKYEEKGLIIESTYANRLASINFTSGTFTKVGSTVSETTDPIMGTVYLMEDTATLGKHYLQKASLFTSGIPNQISVYFKYVSGDFSVILKSAKSTSVITSSSVIVNPLTEAITTRSDSSATIDILPNGWRKLTCYTNGTLSATQFILALGESATNTGFADYLGDGSRKLLIAYPQAIQDRVAKSSFIENSSTKSADNIEFKNLLWYRQNQGTFLTKISDLKEDFISSILNISGVADYEFNLRRTATGTVKLDTLIDSVEVSLETSGIYDENATIGFSFNGSMLNLAVNGELLTSSGDFSGMDSTQILIGRDGVNYLEGTMEYLVYYPYALTGTDLQLITRKR